MCACLTCRSRYTDLQEQIDRINEAACHSPLLAEYLRHPTHPMQLPIYVLNVIRDVEDNAAFLARCPRPAFHRRDGTFNILAIDGGGLRGLIPAIILERLSDRFPRLLDAFDMIAGTSSGAILGTVPRRHATHRDTDARCSRRHGEGPAPGRPPDRAPGARAFLRVDVALTESAQALSKRIFVSSGFLGRFVPAVHAKFNNDILRLLCEGMWTDQQMKDIKRCVLRHSDSFRSALSASRYLLIPYFSLDQWHIVAAHNLDPNGPTAQEKVADCVVRSAQPPAARS